MSDPKHCAECEAPLPAYWPKGLCAQCALDGALAMANAESQVLQAETPAITPAESKPPEPSPESSPLGSFGDYELLEEVARGGMGVVYKARQEKLGRIVAVKMILAGPLAGKDFVRRFRTESAAAAILQHPNIVAIHDVGVHEGRHYFSMDYVAGQNLAQLVGQQPLPPARAARYVEAIAEAIHYAHERGILHRDLKPSNVLIDANDQPRITDFGLAKRLDGESSLTLSGHVLGSPNFMPPEQAGAKRGKVGRPSDVYALGGILYYLLTARAPFQAESLEGIIAQVLNAEPVAPRLLNPAVPKDLETITLKCLEKEPSRRFQTAQELADELNRFLLNEPIQARPVGHAEKLWRWCRRKPAVAGLVVALHIALVVGLAGILWQWRRASFNARAEANQRQRAEANFQKAREAVDRMFTSVATELNDVPHMEQIRRKLLEDALEFYQDFLKQKGDDAAVRHGAALTYVRVGNIYNMLGQYDKSLEPLEQAITILADLAKLQPTEARYRAEMAEAHDGMAYASFSIGRFSAAIAHRQKALALYEELQREFPTAPGYLREAANAYVDLGNALRGGDRTKESVDEFRQALKLCAKHRADFPDVPEDQVLLAHIHHWLGVSLKDIGFLEEAETEYREAHDLRKQLVAEQPHNVRLKHLLGHVKAYLAALLMNTDRLDEAEELLQQATAIDEKLMDDFPGVEDYRRVAAWDYELLGSVLSAMRRTREAEAALRHSLAIREKVVADLPGVQSKHMDLATVRYNLGLLLESVGRTEEAAELFREAISTFEKLTAADPEVPLYQNKLGWMLATCPAVQCRDPERAVKLAKQALKYEPEAVKHWRLLGIAQYRAGDPTAAVASLHKTMELANGGGAQQWLFLAMAHWQKGNRQEARQWYDKAVAWIDKNHPADEEYDRFRAEAAEVLGKPEAK